MRVCFVGARDARPSARRVLSRRRGLHTMRSATNSAAGGAFTRPPRKRKSGQGRPHPEPASGPVVVGGMSRRSAVDDDSVIPQNAVPTTAADDIASKRR